MTANGTAAGSAATLLERLASRAERFPGAVLLVGPSAAALEAEARRIAERLICGADHGGAACETCRRTAAGSHPDLLLVEPEGVSIKIDRVREALAFAAGRPYEARRRVVLLLKAEKLGVEAGNALLKSLEEPGTHLHWILTTARPEALLPTIRSRCVTLPVPPSSRGERVAAWTDLGFSAEDAEDLARISEDRRVPDPNRRSASPCSANAASASCWRSTPASRRTGRRRS